MLALSCFFFLDANPPYGFLPLRIWMVTPLRCGRLLGVCFSRKHKAEWRPEGTVEGKQCHWNRRWLKLMLWIPASHPLLLLGSQYDGGTRVRECCVADCRCRRDITIRKEKHSNVLIFPPWRHNPREPCSQQTHLWTQNFQSAFPWPCHMEGQVDKDHHALS